MAGAFGRLGGITGAVGVLCLVASAAPTEPGGWFAEVAGVGVGLVLLGLVAIYIHAHPVLPAWAGLGLVLPFASIAGFLSVWMLVGGVNLYFFWLGVGLVLLALVAIHIYARPVLSARAGLGLILAFASVAGLLWTFMILSGDGDLWLSSAALTVVGISVFLAGLHRGSVVPLWALGMLATAQVVGIFAYEAYWTSGRAGDLLAWTALALAAAGWAWTAIALWSAPRSPGSTATRRPALH